MATAHLSLTLQLLEWVLEKPRTYAALMEAWKTSCPRLAIWEDACSEGLVGTVPGHEAIVVVTDRGKALLAMKQREHA